MMNKYQRALDEIKNMLNDMTQNENDSFKYHYYIKLGTVEVLQELVDKATPKKPTFVESYPSGECPNCDESIGGRNYCHNCGQALDWSEND